MRRAQSRVRAAIAAIACVALLAIATQSAGAQQLRGTVKLESTAAPAAGVIIEVSTMAGLRVTSTLTDARGFFVVDLPAGDSVSMRALRIGFRPTSLGTFQLSTGEERRADFVLSGEGVQLERFVVSGRDVCGRAPTDGLQVATMFDEARKALRSTKLTSAVGQLTAEWVLTSQRTTLQLNPISEAETRAFRGPTDRPFVSLPPDSLARAGYLEQTAEDFIFHAPDADALLSDSFAESNCFRIVEWDRDARDWIGLGFRPARAPRDWVGIEGTLWLDRRTSELKRLEYRYANVPRELAGTPAGGSVEFLRLPNGSWLVNRWEIRMPRPTVSYASASAMGEFRGYRRIMRVQSMQIAGGEVREVMGTGQLLYSAADNGVVREVVRTAETMSSLCETSVGARDAIVWGVVSRPDGTPPTQAEIRVQWSHEERVFTNVNRITRTASRSVKAAADGLWYACGVPRGEPLAISALVDGVVTRPIQSVVATWEGGKEIYLSSGDIVGVTTASLSGRVVDSLRADGTPVAGIPVRLLGTARETFTDSDGRFQFDSVPPGTHEFAAWDEQLRSLRLPPLIARATVEPGSSEELLTIAVPTFSSVFSQYCGRAPVEGEGLLLGEVRDLGGIARADVPVFARWYSTLFAKELAARDERVIADTTDSAGRFVLCGVPRKGEVTEVGDRAIFASGELTLVAERGVYSTDSLTLSMNGAPILRRDLIVGTLANRARISGRVLDQLGRPIAGATVGLSGFRGTSTRSDSSGRWAIDGVQVRSTTLTVRALRYAPSEFPLDPIDGRFVIGDVRLENASQVMTAVMIRGRFSAGALGYRQAFEERRRTLAFGTFIDDEVLSRQPVVTSSFVVSRTSKARNRTMGDSGTRILRGQSKIALETDFKGLDPTGSGAMSLCYPRWYVDGVDFRIPFAEEEALLLSQAKRIEIYRASMSPPEFHDFDGCGVVLIWTR